MIAVITERQSSSKCGAGTVNKTRRTQFVQLGESGLGYGSLKIVVFQLQDHEISQIANVTRNRTGQSVRIQINRLQCRHAVNFTGNRSLQIVIVEVDV